MLYDLRVVSTKEPFQRLVNQGVILGEDGQKMSKSRGNVVNPDEVIDGYGADTMRLYEMFMGPLEQSKAWSNQGAEGVYRFLGRVWRLFMEGDGLKKDIGDRPPSDEERRFEHRMIKKVTEDLERMAFNTAISALMIFVNEEAKFKVKSKRTLENFLLALSPFAPHMAEELWARMGHRETIIRAPWPRFEARWIEEEEIEIVIQINGRVRSRMKVPSSYDEEKLKDEALRHSKARGALDAKKVIKVIVVPKRLVNIVAG